MTVRRIDLTNALWDDVAAADPAATVFHTRAWAESAVAGFANARLDARAYALDDSAVAVLPVLLRRYGPFVELQCAPDASFGGPIAQRGLTDAEAGEIVADVRRPMLSRLVVNGNPFADWQPSTMPRATSSFTQVVGLNGDTSAAFRRLHPSARTNVRKAERTGLVAIKASSEADLDAYMHCYEETLARWGRATMYRVSRRRFATIRDYLGEACVLWLVTYEGRVIGGDLVLYHNGRAFYWHGATSNEGLRLNAAVFLQWRILADACKRGCSEVDLGTSAGASGLEQFKSALGAERRAFRQGVAESALFRLAHEMRELVRRRLGQ